MIERRGPCPVWLAPLLAAACGSAPPAAMPGGAALFASTALSSSSFDLFTCATCHDATGPTAPSIKPGAPLAGATLRGSFWGGQENDLLRSINDCRTYFMDASDGLAARDPDAIALYAYLRTLEPGQADPVPFTVVSSIADVARGDATGGAAVYTRACGACHGRMHDGAGRLAGRIPILPEETLAVHASFSPSSQRLIFIEKVRHGGFFGYGGDMPPFSLQALSDADLGDLLEGLGVLGS